LYLKHCDDQDQVNDVTAMSHSCAAVSFCVCVCEAVVRAGQL